MEELRICPSHSIPGYHSGTPEGGHGSQPQQHQRLPDQRVSSGSEAGRRVRAQGKLLLWKPSQKIVKNIINLKLSFSQLHSLSLSIINDRDSITMTTNKDGVEG